MGTKYMQKNNSEVQDYGFLTFVFSFVNRLIFLSMLKSLWTGAVVNKQMYPLRAATASMKTQQYLLKFGIYAVLHFWHSPSSDKAPQIFFSFPLPLSSVLSSKAVSFLEQKADDRFHLPLSCHFTQVDIYQK